VGLQEGFRWLRDVADGILLSDQTIVSEHGVVIAEEVAAEREARRVSEIVSQFQAPELRSPHRGPIGLARSIKDIDARALEAFYERWYRPENAVVVIASDRPVEELEQMVRANFESWQAKGPKPVRAPLGRVNIDRGLDSIAVVSRSLPQMISACRVQAPSSPSDDEMTQRTREVRRAIWQGILVDRLKRLVEAGTSGLLHADVFGNENVESSATCLVAIPLGEDWRKALTAAQIELLRFAKDGPTEQELEAQIEEQRSLLRGAISSSKSRTASAIADRLLQRATEKRAQVSDVEAMHAFNVVVEDMDTKSILTAFRSDWSGAGPLLSLVLPTSEEAGAPRAAWQDTEKLSTLPAYADAGTITWPYEDFGDPGKVVRKEFVQRPGFTRFHFSNGVILNFKQLSSEAQAVDLRVRFGAGRRQLPNEDTPAALFGAGMLISGGLGRLPAADIDRHFRNISWKFDFYIGNESFELSHSGIKANLSTTLEIIAAYMSDPGFRSDADSRIPVAIDIAYRNIATNPQAALGEAFASAMDPKNPMRLPPQDQLSRLSSKDFERVLKAPLTTESIEVSIAGDIDEQDAISFVGRTLGALPARQSSSAQRSDTHFLRVPDNAIPDVATTHDGPEDQAAARLAWPLYVASPSRRREEYALQLVAGILGESLRHKVRSEMGKVYDPRVHTQMPDHADQGLMIIDIAGQPADISRLVDEARNLALKVASGDITADELDAARKPKLSAFAALRDKNRWWTGVMSGSARNPESIDELVEYEQLMTAVTLDEVKAAAARWLARPPMVAVALPKAIKPESSPVVIGSSNGGNDRRVTK
jgi:zinc protease